MGGMGSRCKKRRTRKGVGVGGKEMSRERDCRCLRALCWRSAPTSTLSAHNSAVGSWTGPLSHASARSPQQDMRVCSHHESRLSALGVGVDVGTHGALGVVGQLHRSKHGQNSKHGSGSLARAQAPELRAAHKCAQLLWRAPAAQAASRLKRLAASVRGGVRGRGSCAPAGPAPQPGASAAHADAAAARVRAHLLAADEVEDCATGGDVQHAAVNEVTLGLQENKF